MKVETLQMSKTMSKPIKPMSQKFPKQLGNRQTKENTACVFKNCKTAVLWSGVKVSRKTLLGEVWRAWRAALHVVTGLMWLEKWSLSFVYLTDHSSGIFWYNYSADGCVKKVLVGADLLLVNQLVNFNGCFTGYCNICYCACIDSTPRATPCGSHRHPDPKTNLPGGVTSANTPRRVPKRHEQQVDWDWLEVSATWFRTMAPISTF